PGTVGLWRAVEDGVDVVVKRLRAPEPHDPAELSDPTHPAYWRRDAELSISGLATSTPGLRAPRLLSMEEDEDGVTLVHEWVDEADNPGLFLARNLCRLAAAETPSAAWLARRQLARRVEQVERRGGWTALARTPVADWADHLWRH